MACENCGKVLETREFDGKNLCYDCAIKLCPPTPIEKKLSIDILNNKSVKYKFSKTQEEIKKEEFYKKNIKNVLKQFDDIFKREEFDYYVNAIEKFLNSDVLQVLNQGALNDDIMEFFLNEFRDRIYDLLNKGKIEHAEKLACLYINYGKKYYLVPGLMYEPLIQVKKAKEEWEEVVEYMILSLKDKIERYEEYDWQEDISESIQDLSKIMKNLFSYIRKLKIDSKNLEVYDAYIRNKMNQDIKPPLDKLMVPETPYTNRKIIVDIIRDRCKDFIFWEDPYFTGRGFDFLCEGL